MLMNEIMKEYDKSKTGTLSRKEVKDMAEKILGRVAPAMGGLDYDEIELIMCCGGSNVRPEITMEELPEALAIISGIKEENEELEKLFKKYDVDKSGDLPSDQLKPLLTEVNEGPVTDADVTYVLKQCEPRGVADPIKKTQLKAALACWYTHTEEDVSKSKQEDKEKEKEKEKAASEKKAAPKKAAPKDGQGKKASQESKENHDKKAAHDKKAGSDKIIKEDGGSKEKTEEPVKAPPPATEEPAKEEAAAVPPKSAEAETAQPKVEPNSPTAINAEPTSAIVVPTPQTTPPGGAEKTEPATTKTEPEWQNLTIDSGTRESSEQPASEEKKDAAAIVQGGKVTKDPTFLESIVGKYGCCQAVSSSAQDVTDAQMPVSYA